MYTNQKIVYSPIGIIHSPFKNAHHTPRQASGSGGKAGTVEIYEPYVNGLVDLEGFSHIILICHLHLSISFSLRVVPWADDQQRGLFATRSPSRPNPIGLSVVQLTGIQRNLIGIRGLDLLDGTPVLDIKPYIPELDAPENVRIGWLENIPGSVRRDGLSGKEK